MDVGLALSAGGLTLAVGILSENFSIFSHKRMLELLLETATGILISVVCFGLLPQTFSWGGALPGVFVLLVGCILYLTARLDASRRVLGWFFFLPGMLLSLTFFSTAGWLTAFCTGVACGAMLAAGARLESWQACNGGQYCWNDRWNPVDGGDMTPPFYA